MVKLRLLRQLRDEILQSDNAGRKRHLILQFDPVYRITTSQSVTREHVTITLFGGWEFHTNAFDIRDALDEAARKVYAHLRTKYLGKNACA